MEMVSLRWNFDSVKVFFSILSTFALTSLAWIFFRAKTIGDAFEYIKRMFSNGIFNSQYLENERYNYELLLMVIAFVIVEWNFRNQVEPISGKYSWLKLGLCFIAIIALGTYSDYKEFIYFQF